MRYSACVGHGVAACFHDGLLFVFGSPLLVVTCLDRVFCREKNQNLTLPCTVNFIWAMKRDKYLTLRKEYDFPHLFILEQPWFWRVDPVDSGRHWHFFGWDYLNGYVGEGRGEEEMAWKDTTRNSVC